MAAIAHIKMTLNVAYACLSFRLGWPAVVLDAHQAYYDATAVLPVMFIHVQVHVPERLGWYDWQIEHTATSWCFRISIRIRTQLKRNDEYCIENVRSVRMNPCCSLENAAVYSLRGSTRHLAV